MRNKHVDLFSKAPRVCRIIHAFLLKAIFVWENSVMLPLRCSLEYASFVVGDEVAVEGHGAT